MTSSAAQASKSLKQREGEAVKQAEEHGYFLKASKSFIEKKYLGEKNDEAGGVSFWRNKDIDKDLAEVHIVKLPSSRLPHVGDIGLCSKLTICDLSNNYITKLDALAPCTQLIRLDVHGNQITLLPEASFWSSMVKLKLINLHDNPLGKTENLQSLAGCPTLLALTLYDTPLGLKRNYRHHVVNTIWTLKALDNKVISDEEIIEDANFGGRFAAQSSAFTINLCPPTPAESTYEEEMALTWKILADINFIMAHHSPVILIQRYVRGHLLRKHFKFVQDTRIWAAVTIQRTYRGFKGLVTPRSLIPPLASSTVAERPVTEPELATLGHTGGRSVDIPNLDYDTYLKNRRPGSGVFSEGSLQSSRRSKSRGDYHNKRLVGPAERGPPEVPINSAASNQAHRGKKNIFINLAKLETNTLQSFCDTGDIPSTGLFPKQRTTAKTDIHEEANYNRRKLRKKESDLCKRKVVATVKQFLGPQSHLAQTWELGAERSSDDPEDVVEQAEDIPKVNFRLRGRKQTPTYYDPTIDVLMSRMDAGKDVRAAEEGFHRKREADRTTERKVKAKSVSVSKSTYEQRMFSRVQGTMGMTCLQAIQQAYRDRERAERKAASVECVIGMREQSQAAKERIRAFHEQRRLKAMKDKERDQKLVLEVLQRQELQRQDTNDKYQHIYARYSQQARRLREELTFVTDFSLQNTSVSNALQRHDRQAREDDTLQAKSALVRSHRDFAKDQQALVKRYMEHRQLMRQTESAVSRAAVDTRMLQEANERLIEARQRVAQQKARSDQVATHYALPALCSNSQRQLSANFGTSSVVSGDLDDSPMASLAMNSVTLQKYNKGLIASHNNTVKSSTMASV